jgi:hypothetical protein
VESITAKTIIDFVMGKPSIDKLLAGKPLVIHKDDFTVHITLDQETLERLRGGRHASHTAIEQAPGPVDAQPEAT